MKPKKLRGLGTAMLLFGTVVLLAPGTVPAASLLIDDLSPTDPFLTFSMNDFEGGFSINGTQVQSGLRNPQTVTLAESNGAPSHIFTFEGRWLLGAPLVSTPPTALSDTVYFIEPGTTNLVSDILQYTYTTDSSPSIGFGTGHLVGFFTSDVESGTLGPVPVGAHTFDESKGLFTFNQTNLTAAAISAVPEPSTLLMAGTGISAVFAAGWYRRRRDQRRHRPVWQLDETE